MTTEEKRKEFGEYLKDKKIEPSDLKEMFKVSQPMISALLNGKKQFGKKLAAKWSDELGVRASWLLTGEGEMLKTDTPYLINHDRHGTPYFDVDFVNGFDLMCNDQTTNPSYYIDFQQYNNADCWVNATGDSMKPLINHGDIVAVKRLDDWPTYLLYGEIYAIVTDKFRTIKKVRKSTKGDGHLRLVPLNTNEFDEQDIPKDTIRVVFQVLGCAKKIF